MFVRLGRDARRGVRCGRPAPGLEMTDVENGCRSFSVLNQCAPGQSWRTLSTPEDSALAILPPKTGFCMRRLERDSCPFLLILTLLFRFCLLDLILPVPFPRTQPPGRILTQLPFLPNRSDSVRPILALSDSVARLRFLPPDAGKGIFRSPPISWQPGRTLVS